MKKYLNYIMVIGLCSFYQNSTIAQSYFPLDFGTTWTYNTTYFATSDTGRNNMPIMLSGAHNREVWGSTEITYEVKKDSIVNKQTYKVITNTKNPFDIDLIREENGNYFRLNTQSFKEENFLKGNLKVGDLWLDYQNAEQTLATLYMVVSLDKTKNIKGKTYNNVIGIGEITSSMERLMEYLQEDSSFIPTKYYAEGIGLVYSYFPYPVSNSYSDVEQAIKQ